MERQGQLCLEEALKNMPARKLEHRITLGKGVDNDVCVNIV